MHINLKLKNVEYTTIQLHKTITPLTYHSPKLKNSDEFKTSMEQKKIKSYYPILKLKLPMKTSKLSYLYDCV
jgi:UDP-galactopyranose mutase